MKLAATIHSILNAPAATARARSALTMATTSQIPPPPGSDAAIKAGCTCPVLDNHHGVGAYTDRDTGKPVYLYSSDCPVHPTGGVL